MWDTANILKISKSIKLLVKMKNVYFILRKKLDELFGQPNIKGLSYPRIAGRIRVMHTPISRKQTREGIQRSLI